MARASSRLASPGRSGVRRQHGVTAPAQVVAALAAHDDALDRTRCRGAQALLGDAQDRGVVGTREAAVGGDQHQRGDLHLALLEQRMLHLGRGSGEVREHGRDLGRIGTRGLRARLRAAQLRRGHHLHGLEDLLHALGGADAPPEVFQGCHGLTP
jgi:hypothetical protein